MNNFSKFNIDLNSFRDKEFGSFYLFNSALNKVSVKTPLLSQLQAYRFSKRYFAGAKPKETGAKFTIEFEVNLNNANEMYVYNLFRAWANLVYDPLTGRQGLKKDYAPNGAGVYVGVHNRAGDVYREFNFSPVFVYGDTNLVEEMKLDYTSDTIYSATFSFIADSYTEVRNGQF